MRLSTILAASIFACLLTAATSHALTVAYGQREVADAGVGCVGGWMSDHGSTTCFRGDTRLLNKQLASMAKDEPRHRSIKLVLHAGESIIDDPEEQPITHAGQARNQISVDWSVSESCPFDKVLTGRCKCDERNLTVHIWVANEIRLNDLIVPSEFIVRSAGDIDEFVRRHAGRK